MERPWYITADIWPVVAATLDAHPDTLEVGLTAFDLGSSSTQEGRDIDACAYFAVALHLLARHLGPEHRDTLACYSVLAEAYAKVGRANEAVALFRSSLESHLRTIGPDDLHTLTIRHYLAESCRAAGQLNEAVKIHELSYGEYLRVVGLNHRNTLRCRNGLAEAYRKAERLAEAVRLHEENLSECVRVVGEEHSDTISTRSNLALAYKDVGRLQDSMSLNKLNLDVALIAFGTDNKTTLTVRDSLAMAYAGAGRLSDAIPLLEHNLSESLRLLGSGHPNTLIACNNLSVAYGKQGRVAEAISMEEWNLAQRLRILGESHPHTIDSRNNLAQDYLIAGWVDEGIALHEINASDCMRLYGPEHPTTIRMSHNLGLAHLGTKRQSEAIPLLLNTLKICEDVMGNDHPHYLMMCSGLAEAYRADGQLVESIRLSERNLYRCGSVLGDVHPETLLCQSLLAATYLDAGRTHDAIRYYRQSLKLELAVLGDHPNVVITYGNLALACRSVGQIEEAESLLKDCLAMAERVRVSGIGAVSRATVAQILGLDVLAFILAGVQTKLSREAASVLSAIERGTSRSILDLLLRRPGNALVLARELVAAGRWTARRLAAYEEDVRLAGELTATDAAVAYNAADVKAARPELSAVRARIGSADQELFPAAQPRTLTGIQAVLSRGEILLVFGWCHLSVTLTIVPAAWSGEARSLLLANAADERRVEATRIADVGRAAATARACLLGECPVAGLTDATRELFSFILPAEARAMLAGASRVIVVPSGPLHDLPLDVLAEAAGVTELIGVPVVTAPSASVYAMLRERGAGDGPYWPGIVGDPEFGPVEPGLGAAVGGTRSVEAIERELMLGERAGGGLAPLPWARVEARQVADLFSRHLGQPVSPVVGPAATVRAVHDMAGGKRFLLLAAHAKVGGLSDPMGSAVFLAPEAAGESGLLRLDMLLTHWRDRLLGCDLVVLSSCDSGRGVRLGDSRMALPIGFFHAGTRCVLASLWPVADMPSWLLMRRFHENLLGERGKAMDVWSALAEARRFVRTMTVRKLIGEIGQALPPSDECRNLVDEIRRSWREHPFADYRHWAAFVLIGAVD